MDINKVDSDIAVAPQILADDIPELVKAGYKTIICNRPDGEGNDQPLFHEIEEAATRAGLAAHYLPVESGKVSDDDAEAFGQLMEAAPKPVLAYCRTGTRSITLWSLEPRRQNALAGDPREGEGRRLRHARRGPPHRQQRQTPTDQTTASTMSSSSAPGPPGSPWRRPCWRGRPTWSIAVIDPADIHYYQPGWTLVGGGVFDAERHGPHACLGAAGEGALDQGGGRRLRAGAQCGLLEGCRLIEYGRLVVCPGPEARLAQGRRPGRHAGQERRHVQLPLRPAPYTWELVKSLRQARRSSPSRRCRSNAPARRRRRCISPPTTGRATVHSAISTSLSTTPAACCSGSRTTCPR